MDIAMLCTHLPDPPWGALTRPANATPMEPFSRLAAPAWATATAAYLRDMELLTDRLVNPKAKKPRDRGNGKGDGAGKGADPKMRNDKNGQDGK